MNSKKILISSLIFLAFPLCGFTQSLQLADSLRHKGEIFKDKGNFPQAEFYLREALQIYSNQNDTAGWLNTGQLYASTLVHRSKYDEAFDLYNRLLNTSHPRNYKKFRGDILNSMGWASNRMGKYDEALKYFEQALPLSQEAKYTLLTGVIYDNMGLSYYEKGNYGRSLELRKRSLQYFQELNNDRSLAITYNNIALLYERLLLYDKALYFYTQSLEIREKLNNVNLLATIYDNIGKLQKETGNYDQALISFQKSLEYRQQAGAPQRTASTLNNIGTLYSELGNFARALDYYNESLKIRKEVSTPTQLATLHSNIANRQLELGNLQQAADYYENSLSLRRQVGNARQVAKSLIDLARLESIRSKPLKALAYANSAFAIADSVTDYSLLTNSSIWLGRIEQTRGNISSALSHYKNSLAYSRFLSKDSQIFPLMTLAKTYNTLESDSALVYGQETIALIEEGRSKTGSNSAIKADYFKQYSDFYIDMASWTLNYEEDMAKAYYLVEQAKARTLGDELVQASQRIDEKLPEEVRIERNDMLTKIDRLYTKLQATEDESTRNNLEAEIRKAELKYAAYQNELHEKYPQYKKLELQKPVSLERAQALNEPETATLEYAVNDSLLLAFFISAEEVSAEQYSLAELKSSQNLEPKQLVQGFKDAILAHAGRAELDLLSADLYNLLMEPFEQQLADHSNLLIVPDGVLAYLPFEAIRNDNQYLIERFNIKYMPSITSLTLLKDPKEEQERQLLAVAGSEVMNVNSETGRRITTLSALPSTLIEVDSIASHFTDVTTLKEEQVTEEALTQQLGKKYKYIHLATHGIIDEDQPAQSGLRLTGTQNIEASSAYDGLLKSSEIYQLNLGSDMVVLSACNTGVGKLVNGEGMLGLQRSFFYAGTSSVVVSLWSVYDRSTAHLMNEFYKSILSGDHAYQLSWMDQFGRWIGWNESIPFGEKAAAMRTAKLRMVNHPLFNHPVYWAPFIVVGR